MVELRMQCVVEVTDEVGRLATLTGKIRDAGINIDAVCAWVHQGVGYLRMVTDDHDKVYTAISPMVDKCEFSEVVYTRIPNQPGQLDRLAARLARAGIRINLLYAAGGDESVATVVLETDNNVKAVDELTS